MNATGSEANRGIGSGAADPGGGLDFADYATGIGFRFVSPMSKPWPFHQPRYLPPRRLAGARAPAALLRKLDLALEIRNTRLPAGEALMRDRLASLCEIPRMSTFAIASMINVAVSRLRPPACFVNVGVWHGFTLLAGMAGNPDATCIGVDDFSEFGGPRDDFLRRFERRRSPQHHFFDADYDEYFSRVHDAPIGFYVYDGEHSYEHQLQGLRAAEPFFSDDCLVLVDDTNLPAPREALRDFVEQSAHEYRVLCDRRTRANLHPTLWNGVTVVQRVS